MPANRLKFALLHFRVLTGAGTGLAMGVLDLHRRELRRGITHHQDGKRQQQDRPGQVHHAHVRRVVMGHVGNQQTGQRRDCHINQKAHGHMIGLVQYSHY
jgi:hypothetical protein